MSRPTTLGALKQAVAAGRVARRPVRTELRDNLLARLKDLVRFLLPLYQREGKAYLTIALGCTGGKHRSVAFVETLRAFLEDMGLTPLVRHRDLGRE